MIWSYHEVLWISTPIMWHKLEKVKWGKSTSKLYLSIWIMYLLTFHLWARCTVLWFDSAKWAACSHVASGFLVFLAQNLCPDQHGTLHNRHCYQKVWPDIPHVISLTHTLSFFLSSSLCLRTRCPCRSSIPARWVMSSVTLKVGNE